MNEQIATLVRTHDPDRFLTAAFAPPPRRDSLLTLYAFAHELARARAVTSEPHLALIRLHWWREVVEGTPKRHEIATPLSALLAAGDLTPALLLPIIDAHETEAEPAIETIAAWRAWLLEGEGGVAVAAAHLLGAPEPEAYRCLGAACGAARVVRWNAVMAAQGRCLLPLDFLAHAGLSMEAAIAAPAQTGPVIRRLAGEGREFLAAWRGGRPSRDVIAALLPSVLARRDLRRAERASPVPRGLGDRLAVIWAGLTGTL